MELFGRGSLPQSLCPKISRSLASDLNGSAALAGAVSCPLPCPPVSPAWKVRNLYVK